MKMLRAVAAFAAVSSQALAASPIEKVVQLISNLEVKVQADAEESKKIYNEFAAWCEDRAANLNFEIKTGESRVQDLQATIGQETALIAALTSKVEELSSSIATADADLKAATGIRTKEAADFAAVEKDLVETIDMLKRAIAVIEREMRKGGASLAQINRAGSLEEAFTAMVQASVLDSRDATRLSALVQSKDAEADANLGAPEAAAYTSQSGSIVKTLQDLKDQGNAQLSDARKQETSNLHNFEKLKQSLEDQIKFGTKELNEAKSSIAAASERKSAAEGDLSVTSKDLAEDKQTLEDLHHDCLTKAEDYAAESKSRSEELAALAQAKQAIVESTSGAQAIAYGLNQVSFLQLKRSGRASTTAAGFEAVRIVRELARQQQSSALMQLAANMAAMTSTGAGQDPFAKIKSMISDMISKLENEAGADASHKAYCDQELAEANAKHAAKTDKVEKLTTKIDQQSARSAQLKSEVAALQNALAELARTQAEMDKVRQAEHELFVGQKADLEQGIAGVQAALKTLKDYYGQSNHAHGASDGAATGILGLLEVVESDLSKGLAEIVAAEQTSLRNYQQQTKDNEIEKAAKEQDVKYKNKEAADLDKSIAESSSDRKGVQAELDAVSEYLVRLHEECDAKAEPYAEKAARREAEIEGLKNALEVLSPDALLQTSSAKRSLRGHA